MGERTEEPTLSGLLPVEAVVVGIEVPDWKGAIRAAGEVLVAAGITTDGYTEEMQATVNEHGPYIVIAPGLALAHARPSTSVLRTGLSWARLRSPVEFGHPTNDPVNLVIGLAAVDHDQHSTALSQLAGMLSDPDRAQALMAASTPEEVHNLISDYEGAPGQ